MHAISGASVEVGSNLVYAATHQFGDPDRRIPARPYLGLSADDERDIEALKNRVVADLRREQANLIVGVAGRLVAQNLDTERNRALADKLIAEF